MFSFKISIKELFYYRGFIKILSHDIFLTLHDFAIYNEVIDLHGRDLFNCLRQASILTF